MAGHVRGDGIMAVLMGRGGFTVKRKAREDVTECPVINRSNRLISQWENRPAVFAPH